PSASTFASSGSKQPTSDHASSAKQQHSAHMSLNQKEAKRIGVSLPVGKKQTSSPLKQQLKQRKAEDIDSVGNMTLHHKPKAIDATNNHINEQQTQIQNTHYEDTMFGDEEHQGRNDTTVSNNNPVDGRTYSPNELNS